MPDEFLPGQEELFGDPIPNRIVIKPKAEPCWCPCQCGCVAPGWTVDVDGLCPDCKAGNHEIPPASVGMPHLQSLLGLAKTYVAQLEQAVADRNTMHADKPC